MLRRSSGASKLSIICIMAFALVVLTLPAISNAMVMSPHRIILNAECVSDNNQDIQAIIHYSGAVDLDGAVSTLTMAGVTFTATNVNYCYIDDNFLISFDREAIQKSNAVQALANEGPVSVEVTVWFNAYEDSDGNIQFGSTTTASGEVEIVLPGKKK